MIMAVMAKGNFSINLGVVKIGGDFSNDDRQCAWELYTEIVTRLAVHGKTGGFDNVKEEFDGELYHESLESVYSFFREMRGIMRKFPVGKIERADEYHLGNFTCAIMNDILRPFLESWQGRYRHWFDLCTRDQPQASPFEAQKLFPELEEFLSDWSDVRMLMRAVAKTLAGEYKLTQTVDEK